MARRASPWPVAALVLALAVLAPARASGPAEAASAQAQAQLSPAALKTAVFAAIAAGTPQQVVLVLDVKSDAGARAAAAAAAADTLGPGAPPHAAAIAATAAATEAVRARALGAGSAADAAGVRVLHAYQYLPIVIAEVPDAAALGALQAEPGIASVDVPPNVRPQLLQNLALIRQVEAAAAGFEGAGCHVAVLDTGADYTRSDLGNCTKPGDPFPCKVDFMLDVTTTDDGMLDDPGQGFHGTNVASIIALTAPKSRLVVFDIFDGDTGSVAAILKGVDTAIALKANGTYNICSINLSVGSPATFSAPCPEVTTYEAALASLRAAGILPVVAAGNEAMAGYIGAPACVPSAVSVGAVYHSNQSILGFLPCNPHKETTWADKVCCFTNRVSFLTMMAPGSVITAGGVSMSGTSQAAPHVAASAAVLRAIAPAATLDQVVSVLRSTGKKVHLPGVAAAVPRVDLYAAAEAMAGTPLNLDRTPPTITSVTLEGGAAYASGPNVTLTIAASDAGSFLEFMCVSLTPTSADACGPYVLFQASSTLPLPAEGAYDVQVYVTDTAGNTSPLPADASIVYDVTPPTGLALSLAGAPTTNLQVVTASISAADAGSGLGSMCVTLDATATLATCAPFVPFAASAPVSLGAAGAKTVRVFVKDKAGNGNPVAAQAAITYDPSWLPVPQILVNGGAEFANNRKVDLALKGSALGASVEMCVTEKAATADKCRKTDWKPFAAAVSGFMLSPANGPHTVRAFFRGAGGGAPLPGGQDAASAVVSLDTKPPVMKAQGKRFTAVPGPNSTLAVAFARDATDATSGLDKWILVAQPRVAGSPALSSCANLGPAAQVATFPGNVTSDVTYTFYGVAAPATWYVRVCVTDRAGLMARGQSKTVTIK